MKIVADENMDFKIVKKLRENGVEVLSIAESYFSVDDETVLAIAHDDKSPVLTEDKGFGDLVFRLNLPNHGVVLIRLKGVERDLKAEIVTKVVLENYSELLNSFTVITNQQTKIRKLKP